MEFGVRAGSDPAALRTRYYGLKLHRNRAAGRFGGARGRFNQNAISVIAFVHPSSGTRHIIPNIVCFSELMNETQVCRIVGVAKHPENLASSGRRGLPRQVVMQGYFIGSAVRRRDLEVHLDEPIPIRREREFFGMKHPGDARAPMAVGRRLRWRRRACCQYRSDNAEVHKAGFHGASPVGMRSRSQASDDLFKKIACGANPPEAEFRAGSLRIKHVALFKGAANKFYHRILQRSTNKISAGCDLRGYPI